MGEKLKWCLAAGLAGFVGFAVWQFLREGTSASRRPRREPWETV